MPAQTVSPMMQQYFEIKNQHPNEILFYRVGDFYEMFYDDALTASRELELTLTGKACGGEERAPMCGVPYHSYETYAARLIAKGYKVAICEQVEDPALAKGIVKRDIIRVITPGTVIESSMLAEDKNNYLCSIVAKRSRSSWKAGICFADISTGEAYATELPGPKVGNAIVADVESRIAEIPEEDRPSALILWKYNDGVPQVSGDGTFGTYWLRRLGVEDPALEASGFSQVSMEQIYSWDPDILFVDGPGLISIRSGDILNNTVEGADFSSLKAVKDKRVYGTTLGMWNWFTPNPDAPLVLAWLACRTYPEEFADYPLEDTIRDYYKQWYGYDVTDEELAEMLSY